MPTIGGGSYNPAGLIATMPYQNWSQRRADNDRNLYLQTLLTQQAEQQKNMLLQERQALVNKYEQIRNLPFLPQDQQRMNFLVGEVEKQVQNKITTDYGGDVKRYLNESAGMDAQKFVSSLQSSDIFRNATNNKIQVAQYLEDQKQGKIPMLVEGKRFEDILNDFDTGRSGIINYRGGYKPAQDFLKRIQDSYGDDRFTRQQASKERIVQEMLTDGLTMEQALDQYQQQKFDRIPVFHKYDDAYKKTEFMLDQALKNARINKLGQDSQSAKDSYVDVLGVYNDPFNYGAAAGTPTTFNGQPATAFQTNRGLLNTLDTDAIMSGIGGRLDKKTGYYSVSGDLSFFGNNGKPDKAIKGVSGFRPTGMKLIVTPNGRQLFMVGDAVLGEGQAESAGIEGFIGRDYDFNGSLVENNNTFFGNPFTKNTQYSVKDLLIPMNNLSIADQHAINTERRLKTSITSAAYQNPAAEYYEE